METSNCPECQLPFDTCGKRQSYLLPCSHLICIQCCEKVVQQDTIQTTCKICNENVELDEEWKINFEQYKSQTLVVIINCDKHKTSQVQHYCKREQVLICKKCYLEKHATHMDDALVNPYELYNYLDQAFNMLESLVEKVQSESNVVKLMNTAEQNFTASEFKNVVTTFQAFLLPHLSEQEIQQLYLFIDKLLPQKAINTKKAPSITPGSQEQGGFEQYTLFIFALELEFRNQLKKQIQDLTHREVKFILIYRGSRDGFEAENFHYKCDDKGWTLTFIKTHKNKVFGGFTTVPWTSPKAPKYLADSKAFIFSSTHKQICLQYKNEHNAIYQSTEYLPSFGKDFRVTGISSSDNESHMLGHTYKPPSNDGEKNSSFLAGCSTSFKVIEIEVYQVVAFDPHQ